MSPPPPPNPVEKYIKQSFFDKLKAKVSSAVDSVKSFISDSKKTIKSVVSTISNSKVVKKASSVLNEVTTKVSKATTGFVSNTVSKATNAFNEIKEEAKQVVYNVANFVEENKDAIIKGTIATLTIASGVALAAGTIASGGTLATVFAPYIFAQTSGLASIGFATATIKTISWGVGLSIGTTALSNVGEIYIGHNVIRDDLMGVINRLTIVFK